MRFGKKNKDLNSTVILVFVDVRTLSLFLFFSFTPNCFYFYNLIGGLMDSLQTVSFHVIVFAKFEKIMISFCKLKASNLGRYVNSTQQALSPPPSYIRCQCGCLTESCITIVGPKLTYADLVVVLYPLKQNIVNHTTTNKHIRTIEA